MDFPEGVKESTVRWTEVEAMNSILTESCNLGSTKHHEGQENYCKEYFCYFTVRQSTDEQRCFAWWCIQFRGRGSSVDRASEGCGFDFRRELLQSEPSVLTYSESLPPPCHSGLKDPSHSANNEGHRLHLTTLDSSEWADYAVHA